MRLATTTYKYKERTNIRGIRREEPRSNLGVQREKITSIEGIRKEFMRGRHLVSFDGCVSHGVLGSRTARLLRS